jgi:RNA polymerase sigma-70 factor, ECF subfamily
MNVTSQAMTQDTDETDFVSLLSPISRKDETALSQLYDLTANKVYGLALKILTNEADAEEVVCDVYSQLWHKAADFQQERGSAIAWLMVICRSRALDLLRKKRPEVTCSEAIYKYSDNHSNQQPEDMINLLQEGSAVKQAMLQLTEVQRQLIALAYFKDLSHTEISKTIQLPLGTVKSHLRRALQTLHKQIEL